MINIRSSVYFFFLLFSLGTLAQQKVVPDYTAADYARAEKFMSYNTGGLVDKGSVRPNWIENDRFWYRNTMGGNSEFILVDPAKGTRLPAFDHTRLAAALSTASGEKFEGARLPFTTIVFTPDLKFVMVTAARKKWTCDVKGNSCVVDESPATSAVRSAAGGGGGFRGGGGLGITSPDGKLSAYIKDYNLWVKDIASGKETQLTKDGIKDFGYATDNAGWKRSDRPVLAWSPDSKKIATFQQDQRNVSDMYLVTTNVGKPTLQTWKYPLPGDKDIAMIQRVVIDVENVKVVRLKLPPGPHRGTLCDDISCTGGDFGDLEWKPDGSQIAFVTTTRDHKQPTFWLADAGTGEIREVFTEAVTTQFESGRGSYNWRYLSATNEIIWYSERDNWGHLYLYDAITGKLKNKITTGEYVVASLLKVDEKARTLLFYAKGREKGFNPYFNVLYKSSFDGKKLTVLTPDDGNHSASFSPSYKYFVDTYSKQDMPPIITVRNTDGKLMTPLEKADISRLLATGWKMPTPIVVKARDGKIDLYGIMFKPTNLDPNKKYPIINYIYPGPQGGSVSNWGFSASTGDCNALAELGFIVVAIEGTCNPNRSKGFHDMCYGDMADNTLPDQIAGMKELAAKYSYIDIDRVGIWGHSGGGFATVAAMFRFPDFFKVGIAESGNHDNRNYEDDWGERYIGLLVTGPDGKSNYDAQANQNYAKNLKGKLMLAHGMLDDNVPPYNTLLVVDALNKANKDYDLVIFPNSRHGYGEFSLYMTRRRWDYFVKNLIGANPPVGYELGVRGRTAGRNN
ncbi:MAG: DPP IV N-terminal domain-containing protein [Chitinophagaceae bacterium]